MQGKKKPTNIILSSCQFILSLPNIRIQIIPFILYWLPFDIFGLLNERRLFIGADGEDLTFGPQHVSIVIFTTLYGELPAYIPNELSGPWIHGLEVSQCVSILDKLVSRVSQLGCMYESIKL